MSSSSLLKNYNDAVGVTGASSAADLTNQLKRKLNTDDNVPNDQIRDYNDYDDDVTACFDEDDSNIVLSKRSKRDNNNTTAVADDLDARPLKRLSRASLCSNGSGTEGGVNKIGFKTVTGELIAKNFVSINNNPFYLFKILINNEVKEYYGNANHYHDMKIHSIYNVQLNYQNKKIYLGTHKECKNVKNDILVSRYITETNFDDGDTVSVYAKLKYGFKMIDSDVFKMVFHLYVGESMECVKEIECSGSHKKICDSIKDVVVNDENDLLAYFDTYKNKTMRLLRIRCSKNNTNYKSLILHPISEIKYCHDDNFNIKFDDNGDDNDDDCDDNMMIQNVSRANRQILSGVVSKLNAEYASNDRFVINYKVKNSDVEIKASFFLKSNYSSVSTNNENGASGINKKQQKNYNALETDLNQLNEMIENDLIKVYIYVLYEQTKNMYNVLGITKYDCDNNQYESI
ncbi:Late expression factor 3 [Trabala vishnou gigantina nucleopolyhedrovirus]|uniref:Late expression factor 3 n=1 Tax=Trabala vishnou gigantina nucleopolyhedrovirus TaxID=2863583 RepID=UPI002481DE8C|nr:Late expression factor 3 [Trabala vishnou gigantina nucleopolyhedrovirus]QYC92674.1 Late expression factor 3 [Trabala vishnou gigantina nucleopolyhedrovirus]